MLQTIIRVVLLLVDGFRRALTLDVNFARIVERIFGWRRMSDLQRDSKVQHIAYRLVGTDQARIINWAILDFGKKVCSEKAPKCQICPLSGLCLWHLKNCSGSRISATGSTNLYKVIAS